MNLLVMELVVTDLVFLAGPGHPDDPAATSQGSCTVSLDKYETVGFDTTPDFGFNITTKRTKHPPLKSPMIGGHSVKVAAGTTLQAEVAGYVSVTAVGLAWDTVPATFVLNANGTTTWLAIVRTSLEPSLKGQSAASVAAAAEGMLLTTRGTSADTLLAEHRSGWAAVWQSGISIAGDVTVARAINASLYYIHSAMRADFPYGLSPGGLATNSYDGRSFWDTETWMFPVLDLLHPAVGESLLRYRLDRLPAAKIRAAQYGAAGAMFPWTSQLSGFGDTHSVGYCPPNCTSLDWTEQHITGDIAMAFRLHWRSTGDRAFLNESYPLIEAACAFWASRLVRDPGSGNFTIKGVVGPDEPSGVQNDEIYTNAVAASTFRFGIEAATALGIQHPPEWGARAASPYLPLSSSLLPGGRLVHPEFTGYAKGGLIEQSAVALLQYPLLWEIATDIKVNDLTYYEPVTRQDGFFTGDSTYSIAWLALGNASAASTQWASAFAHMDTQSFFTFHEELAGGHLNFLTGAGGFLQNVIQGWSGVRVLPDRLAVVNPTLPTNVTRITLHGVHWRGFCIQAEFDAERFTAELCQSATAATTSKGRQLVLVGGAGRAHPLGVGTGPVSVPIGDLAFKLV
jgi:trehalose/maltose hydrolase-like predicted phosphorylase